MEEENLIIVLISYESSRDWRNRMKFIKKIVGIRLERKRKTAYSNIERMIEVDSIKLPLYGDLIKIVRVGEYVKKGQIIATGEITPSLHSPISGEVEEIITGTKDRDGYEKIIVIKNDYEENTYENYSMKEYEELSIDDFLCLIKDKGITGMGGGYPTYLKIKKSFENKNKILIVNACESEPYLNCDNRLIQEKAKEIIEGINILIKTLKLDSVIIAIEDNKKEAFMELRKALKNHIKIQIKVLKRIYPLGEERILIRELFKREIRKDSFPVDEGYLVQNVATIFSIYEAVILGKPLIDRVLTVAGEGIIENKNLKIKIGTSVKDIANYLKLRTVVNKIVVGGPLTGKSFYDMDKIVIQKNNGGLLFLTKEEINSKRTDACIYCGACVDKCPMGLVPLRFEELVRASEKAELLKMNVNDCIECGVCSYICPSNRPLLESIIIGKKILKEV